MNGTCKCPIEKPYFNEQSQKCEPVGCRPKCDTKANEHLIVDQNCNCMCRDGYDFEDNTCVCKSPKQEIEGKCEVVRIETQTVENKTVQEVIKEVVVERVVENVVHVDSKTEQISLPATALFDLNSSKLRDEAKTALSDFVTNSTATNDNETLSECEMHITGYTDPVGAEKINQKLSEDRAKAVKEYIESIDTMDQFNITHEGKGENSCTCGTRGNQNIDYTKKAYKACKNKADNHTLTGDTVFAPCRRVEISLKCKKTTTTTTETSKS